ncbi:MAG: serine/threonine protein kinase [Moorea sp. SIO3I7]|uniref:serine/threonine-protein kinase n=1 Tax=unclassified Moorena TaxID=2683338 RepID=UPI0013C18834|nr:MULTISPECIES: serine/threonine-protein kinase [unclassified Moorena]NEN94024.1 serine/threonine protein kinase [Moorena sp. SIO3I7]NEO09877.1 serine/threonine protein kinase [Moorena sp. SIO3I8]NEO23523.1 serine/threonine protein kinase [Moorena sp. SIO4A5]NEP21618.1 serine/threonine protein kinase [Moorena sp. SIO3I6]
MLGTTIGGRYHIIDKLGEGTYGQTWLAKDRHLLDSPYCVVKQLKPETTDASEWEIAKRLFEEEAKTLQELAKNDLIPQIMAYLEENDQRYLVQEYIQGHDLSKELNLGEKWQEKRVIELLQQILQALEVIQQHNLIHRDIKPSNLMRREQDKKVVLIDFGAVKKWQPDNQRRAGTVRIGTPDYMAPEQDQGHPNLSSDLYAVGMIGIEALTGELPNPLQSDENGKIIWHNNQVKVSNELAAVLDKMVRYNSDERYSCATQALEALKEVTEKLQPTITLKPLQPNPKAPASPHFNFGAMLLACWFSFILALGFFFLVFKPTGEGKQKKDQSPEKPQEPIVPNTTQPPVPRSCDPWC